MGKLHYIDITGSTIQLYLHHTQKSKGNVDKNFLDIQQHRSNTLTELKEL